MSIQTNRIIFRVVLGNTERPAEEVISHLHRSIPALTGVHIEAAKNSHPGVGQLHLDFTLHSGQLSAADLSQALTDAGGCMFQVESVTMI